MRLQSGLQGEWASRAGVDLGLGSDGGSIITDSEVEQIRGQSTHRRAGLGAPSLPLGISDEVRLAGQFRPDLALCHRRRPDAATRR
jgi:hypothetical protein